MKYLRSAQGLCDLNAQIEDLRNRKKALKKRHQREDVSHSVATDSNGDTAGDEHREHERELQLLEVQINNLTRIRSESIIVDLPTTIDRVAVDHYITIQRYDKNDRPLGRPERLHVVGHQEGDPKANPPKISYDAPIIAQLFGRRVDPSRDPAPVILSGVRQSVELLKIELPAMDVQASNAA